MSIPLIQRIVSGLRFAAITLSIAGLYILLYEIETNVAIKGILSSSGYDSWRESNWQREASRLPQPDPAARASWPRQSRRLVWTYGLWQGRAAEVLNESTKSAPTRREVAERLAAQWASQMADNWRKLTGLNTAPILSFRNLGDGAWLAQRIDKDENGMAAIISQRFSAQHGHLYKLAMLVGMQEIKANQFDGEFFDPNIDLIGRNAMLAGVPRELWLPLTQDLAQSGIQPAERGADYSKRVEKVSSYLAEQD